MLSNQPDIPDYERKCRLLATNQIFEMSLSGPDEFTTRNNTIRCEYAYARFSRPTLISWRRRSGQTILTTDKISTFSLLLTIGFEPGEHDIDEEDALCFEFGLVSNASNADIRA